MAILDVRMEATVRGSDGETLGRVWEMLLGREGRDYQLTHLLVEGGAFQRDALLPFALVGLSSGQQIQLRVTRAEALARAETTMPEGAIPLRRNDPVYAVDARLGHIRGFYVSESGKVDSLLINDEVACRLSMTSVRSVDALEPHQIQLGSRIAAMGELLKPPQAFYEPVELRKEDELVHGHPGSRGTHG
ncbi:MAG TPA: hypothetical protein VFL91_18575 [Thermomicrobiales bacterium]|nr:hypothetical protein [Thermomicrobiales bacterium]